ncbi:MAG: AI-2E family transporter [Firmicutes bacterium]|nr:AI-2E family transporter [Bacillota bacterium]
MNRLSPYVVRAAAWLGLLLASYAFWRWLAGSLFPFLLAAGIAGLVKPLADRLQQFGMPRGWAVLAALLSVLGGVSVTAGSIVLLLFSELMEFTHRMPQYLHERPWHLTRYLRWYNAVRARLGLGQSSVRAELHSLYQLFGVSLKALAHLLLQLPDLALMMVIATLAAFFLLRDLGQVEEAALHLVPPRFRPRILTLGKAVQSGLWGYLWAEAMLVTITGLTTTGGLLLIGAPYAALVGLSAGLLDLVPFLGPTLILAPWAVGAALTGHPRLALHLALVLVGVVVIRQTFEPRLVGQNTGLHPLVVLFSLYMGVRLLGAGGVVAGPMTAVFFNALHPLKAGPRE